MLEPTIGLEPMTCRLRIAHRHSSTAGTRVSSGVVRGRSGTVVSKVRANLRARSFALLVGTLITQAQLNFVQAWVVQVWGFHINLLNRWPEESSFDL